MGTPEAPSFWVCALAFLKFVPHASLCYRLAIAVPSGEMVGEGAHLVLGQPGVPTVWLEACTFVFSEGIIQTQTCFSPRTDGFSVQLFLEHGSSQTREMEAVEVGSCI